MTRSRKTGYYTGSGEERPAGGGGVVRGGVGGRVRGLERVAVSTGEGGSDPDTLASLLPRLLQWIPQATGRRDLLCLFT